MRAQDPFFAELTGASTVGAQRRDELARPLTSTACLIDGEKTLLESKLPGSLAPRADLDVFCALGAATLAVGACLPARDIQLNFLAVDRVLEGDRQIVFNVKTACGSASSLASSEKIVKDVVENVSEAAAAEAFKAPCPIGVAECIIAATFFLIAEDRLGLANLLEFLFCDLFLLVPAGVRVELAGQLSVRLLEIFLCRVSLNAQNFVIVAFHHVRPTVSRLIMHPARGFT